MPTGRILLKAISESRKLSQLKTDGARLLYSWLIPHLDVNGCFSGDVAVINGQVLTRLKRSIREVENYLQDLEDNDLIVRYKANGDVFLHVLDFVKRQPYLNPSRETPPTIPLPTKDKVEKKVSVPKETPKPKEKPTHSLVQEFYTLYNDICTKLPRAEKLTKTREEKIKSRMKEASEPISYWSKVFKKTNDTPFLTGGNERGWRADIDWLIANDTNYIKVLEGKYTKENEDKLKKVLDDDWTDEEKQGVAKIVREGGKK